MRNLSVLDFEGPVVGKNKKQNKQQNRKNISLNVVSQEIYLFEVMRYAIEGVDEV